MSMQLIAEMVDEIMEEYEVARVKALLARVKA